MVSRCLRHTCVRLLGALVFIGALATSAAAKPQGGYTPAPDPNKTRVFGYERSEILDRFEMALNFALHQSYSDPYVYTILKTMDDDIGTDFGPEREINTFDHNKQVLAGLPISGPRGMAALRKEQREYLQRISKNKSLDDVKVAVSLQVFVSSCSPDEKKTNLAVAGDAAKAKWPDKARRDVLRVLNQMRDNGCLTAKEHAKLSKPLAAWLHGKLPTLDQGYVAIAMYDLVRGGYAGLIQPADIRHFLDLQADGGSWLNARQSTDMRSTLCGAYVLGYMMATSGVPVTDAEMKRFFNPMPAN